MSFENFKCRCSGIHKIMSNSRANMPLTEKQAIRMAELEKKESLTPTMKAELAELEIKKQNSSRVILSDTCIEYLMEVYAWEVFGNVAISKEMQIDQLEKGKLAEEEAITLLSVIDGVIYCKNDERITNDYLSGEPDIFLGDNIMNAEKIVDIKSSFDHPSFLKKINVGVENGWEQQVQGYCDISGANIGEIAHCLVDMPEIMALDFKKRLFYKMNVISEESPEFKEKWELLHHSMMFGQIPMNQRVYKIEVEPFTDFERQKVYDRVKVCREWLAMFDEKYKSLNKEVTLQEIQTA